VNIAAGAIDGAAKKVESVLANLLSLAISFLAGFAGLGKIADKIMEVIKKVRDVVDKGIDALINWIVTMAKKLFAAGTAAVKKLFSWAFATTTFKEGDGKQHKLYVNDKGVLTVESDPMAVMDFVKWFTKGNTDPQTVALTADIKALVDKTRPIIDDIEKTKKKKDEPPAPEQQRKLIDLDIQISAKLSELVGKQPLKGSVEKYLLEGQIGTYESIPKPKGDQLTPDHQPQAAIIVAAADFLEQNTGDGGELAERAKKRAAKGRAINLHYNRHKEGRTFLGKGVGTKAGFISKLNTQAGGLTSAKKIKPIIADLLHEEAKADANAVRGLVKQGLTSEAWNELVKAAGSEERAKTLKKDIAARILAGEDQIESQSFDF
jgi:hypothetical protein